MGFTKANDLGQEACQKCGTIYRVQYKGLPVKDRDSFVCKCGHVIRSWNETGTYLYTEAETTDQ
jgi:hypothetical protein